MIMKDTNGRTEEKARPESVGSAGGGMRLGNQNSGSFSYYLHGGTLELSSTGSGATFSLGFNDSTGAPKGYLYVYPGAQFIARGIGGYLGRYQKDGYSASNNANTIDLLMNLGAEVRKID